MTRPKKERKGKDNATITIPLESYMSTRDHVVTSLTTIQGAIGDLLRAYVHHTTQVLGGHAASSELAGATSALLSGIEEATALPAGVPATVAPGVIKKQKQRRKKDPDAPKAPPTAYFLYAKNARPLIKQDLGQDAKGDAVTLEASRRWNELPENEKEGWRNMYKQSFTKYKEDLQAYQAEKAARGELVFSASDALDESVTEALGLDALQVSAAAAAADDDDDDSSDDDDSDDDEPAPPPPPKPADTPKKKPGRPPKAAANGAAPAAASKPKETPVPLPAGQTGAADGAAAKPKAADKKRKAADAVAAPAAAAPAAEEDDEPKKKKKKSKKADNIDPSLEAAVPASSAAEAKKKKRKA